MPDGKNAKASTTIPILNNTLDAKLEKIVSAEYTHTVRCRWSDPNGSKDYYKLAIRHPLTTDTTLANPPLYTSYKLISDKNYDGEMLSANINFSYYKSTPLYAYLLHASTEYFQYTEKLDLYIQSSGPFSDPVQLYTNIEGGLGVFAGFNQFKVKATF